MIVQQQSQSSTAVKAQKTNVRTKIQDMHLNLSRSTHEKRNLHKLKSM